MFTAWYKKTVLLFVKYPHRDKSIGGNFFCNASYYILQRFKILKNLGGGHLK